MPQIIVSYCDRTSRDDCSKSKQTTHCAPPGRFDSPMVL